MPDPFRVGLTRDLRPELGHAGWGDTGTSILDEAPGITWDFLPEKTRDLTANLLAGLDGVAVLGGRVTAETLAPLDRLTIIARYGVGYDTIDVEACTRSGVALTITPDGIRRPMSTAILTFLLALSGRLLQKDHLTRTGGWARKIDYMGTGLTGRTLGLIGVGNIGRDVCKLVAPHDMRIIAFDPYASTAPDGVDLVDLDTLMAESDFVAICCALTPETHHLIDAKRLGQMKPTAYLINTARGPIVDQSALTTALQENRIAGAGLDVFDPEPIDTEDPLLTLDNVILTPHALGWTDHWITNTGRSALGGIIDISQGRIPTYLVNRDVLDNSRFQAKLAEFATRSADQ
jgi:D-3-phosphoglycerate dehydrogenase